MGFDGSSITGFNPIEESDMIAMPDPSSFAILPWRPAEKATGRMFCDIQVPGGEPYEGDPRWILRRALRARRGAGLRRLQHRPRARVLLLQGRAAGGRRARDPRRGRLLRPDHARRRLRRPPRDDPGARAARDPRRVRAPRGRPLPARGRHALQGRARDVRRLHDLPDRGQGVRDEVRLARDLHAEAAVRRERLRHARPPVALEGRAQRLLRPRRPVLPLGDREVVHRRPASTRARDRAAVRAVGQLLQAAGARATRRRSIWPGRGATARR